MTATEIPTFTATKTDTIADQIAALVGGDGMRFDTPDDGPHLQEIMKANAKRVSHKKGRRFAGDPTRYIFADNSVITAAGDAWDFGYTACFCWQGQGNEHQENCEFHDVSVGKWHGPANAALALMDKDITDEMDRDGVADGCRTMQEYVDAYMALHEERHGVAFVVN
jgi:hypothetical protein